MSREKDAAKSAKRYYRKQVDLFSIVQKLNLWPSRKGILHGVKTFRYKGGFGEVTTHCNKVFLTQNSANSRAARWLKNKWFFSTCKKCRIPEWKLKKYSSTVFNRRHGSRIIR